MRLQRFLDTFGDVDDCVTQADIDDWFALATLSPPVEAPVAVKPLEWIVIGQLSVRATPSIGATYDIQEFGSWTRNPFQLVIGEADDAKAKVSHHKTLDAAKAAAQADYEQRIRSALIATPRPLPSVEDVARLIDPDAFYYHQAMIDAGKSDGLTLEASRELADRSTAGTIPQARAKATAILTLLGGSAR